MKYDIFAGRGADMPQIKARRGEAGVLADPHCWDKQKDAANRTG